MSMRSGLTLLCKGILLSSLIDLSVLDTAKAQNPTPDWPNERDAYGQVDAASESLGANKQWGSSSPYDSFPSQVRRSDKPASADGRLTLRNYLSGDNSKTYNSPNVVLSFLEADLHLRDLTDGGLRLDLDSTFILDISQAVERRFGETERFDQVRHLALSQDLGRLSLSAGRLLISQAGNAWVDGISMSYRFDQGRSAFGLYGGLSPDRFDRSLTLDYQAMGLVLESHRDGLDLSAAYNLLLFQGALDRQFFHQRTHFKIMDGLFWSNYLILDFGDAPEVTTLLTTLDYTPVRSFNITLNITQYSLEQYRNQAIYRDVIEPNQALLLGNEVIDLTYRRARLSFSWRSRNEWRPYLSTEFKSRAQDGRQAQFYTVGVSQRDLFKTKIEGDLRVQIAQNFKADHMIFALTLRRELSTHLSLDGRLSHFSGESLDIGTDRQRLFNEAQELYIVGLSVVGRLSRAHHLLLSYDGVYESEVADYKSDEPIMIHTMSLFYSYLY